MSVTFIELQLFFVISRLPLAHASWLLTYLLLFLGANDFQITHRLSHRWRHWWTWHSRPFGIVRQSVRWNACA